MRRQAQNAMVCALAVVAVLVPAAPGAVADPGDPPAAEVVTGAPTQQQVDDVALLAATAAEDVATVRAALVVADQHAQAASEAAAEAAEAYNGARYRAEQAAATSTAAKAAAQQAQVAVEAQRHAYADTITDGYAMSPSLGALSAIASADGITDVIESTASLHNAENAMNSRYDDFRASATIAQASSNAAQRAAAAAHDAVADAEASRSAAEAAAGAAAAQSQAMGAQRDALIARLAQLQDVSIALAGRRQQTLEFQARRASIKAAIREARAKGQAAPMFDAPDGPQYGDPIEVPTYEGLGSLPVIPGGPAPKPGKGAAFAIAFARAQIGDPYVWAAAGPDAWDCSGLTMGAWANGGKALPHYSVAQYAASTPISPADLAPGDLVFWGKSADPASIYHVALYSGNGMIIQAPRSGVPVQEVSMYAWTAPNFYARP